MDVGRRARHLLRIAGDAVRRLAAAVHEVVAVLLALVHQRRSPGAGEQAQGKSYGESAIVHGGAWLGPLVKIVVRGARERLVGGRQGYTTLLQYLAPQVNE